MALSGLYEQYVPEALRKLFWSPKRKLLDAQTKAATAAATLFVNRLQGDILTGKIQLRKRTKAWEKRALTPQILVHTKKYIMGFHVRPMPTLGTAHVVNDNHRLFLMIEHGTRRIKPRPHVALVEKKYRRELAKEMGRRLTKEVFG